MNVRRFLKKSLCWVSMGSVYKRLGKKKISYRSYSKETPSGAESLKNRLRPPSLVVPASTASLVSRKIHCLCLQFLRSERGMSGSSEKGHTLNEASLSLTISGIRLESFSTWVTNDFTFHIFGDRIFFICSNTARFFASVTAENKKPNTLPHKLQKVGPAPFSGS